MATDTGIINADKTVQAVVSYCDVGTVYDPPAAPTPVAPVPEDAVPDIEIVASGPASLTSLESSVEIPDDFTVDGSLAAHSESGDAGPAPGSGPEETSPIGASLIDSDDEPIASRLPGYLNSFKTCEVSALQFSSIHLSHFLFTFISSSDFQSLHLFPIVLELSSDGLFKFSLFIIFSSFKVFKHGVFFLFTF